jgi:DNA primase
MRISPGRALLKSRIEKAKEGIDLLTVAGDVGAELRKKGGRWRGKCPLCDNGAHSDAFSLDEGKGLFYCFACGRGGDLIGLVELWGPFSIPEAVAWLGHTYNLDLPERPASWFKKQDRQARMRARLEKEREMVLKRRMFKVALLPLLEDCMEEEIRGAWEDFKKISIWAFVQHQEATSE